MQIASVIILRVKSQNNLITNNLKNLENTLSLDSYICHKYANDLVNSAKSIIPTSILGYFRLIFTPKYLFNVLCLYSLARSYENKRLRHNEDFIDRETVNRSDFFKQIGGKSLDNQQVQAVIPDEDNVLVIAGAGSGKTLTIEAKIKYLVECLGISADSILPISFTKKSADSMKDRINLPNINPKTFHAFGLGALMDVEKNEPKIFDSNKINILFRSFIKDLSLDDSFLANLTSFFLNYIKIPKSEFEFESLGDYIQYLRDQNYTTYKKVSIPYRGMLTYRNEVVKSVQECVIANFLLFNNIEYDYEAQYDYPMGDSSNKKRYLPDFTIKFNDQKIYLEHFGVDRDNNVPKFFAGPNESYEEARRKYVAGMYWKRETHKNNNTVLVETYSYEFLEDGFLENLRTRLLNAGVPLKPMSEQEIWGVIQDSGSDEVDAFISLVSTFLALMKSNDYDISNLRRQNNKVNKDNFLHERTEQFLLLFEPIYSLYQNYLNETDQIDFNDMITRATEYIESGKYHCPLSYVVIDEFQDLSVGRYKMLAAIRKQNPNVKFYCVGDDWQSIYRFAGSDIALFRDFEKYFGYTITKKIETTYRFSEPLIGMSSDFILKNPNQTVKHLIAPALGPQTTLSIIESNSPDGDDTESLVDAIYELVTKHGLRSSDKAYLIGRYNFDIERIRNFNKCFKINYKKGSIEYLIPNGNDKGSVIHLEFVTAHRAKGLEAMYVIVINCNGGKLGFPSEKADDPLLNLLLSSADQFENGEERRLFYVAITRTKKHVILLADKSRKSKFIKELQNESNDRDYRCPKCKEGDLILRTSSAFGPFYSCSNFAYGCDYKKTVK